MDLFLKYGIQASVVPPATGYLELLHDSGTITSTANTYTISNLNIGKGDLLKLVVTALPVGSSNYKVYFNGNDNSNYVLQYFFANGTSIGSGREAVAPPYVAGGLPSSVGMTTIKITENGYITTKTAYVPSEGTSSIQKWDINGSTTTTASSITSIGFRANNSNGIGVGSRFQLYRVLD